MNEKEAVTVNGSLHIHVISIGFCLSFQCFCLILNTNNQYIYTIGQCANFRKCIFLTKKQVLENKNKKYAH